MFICHVAEHHIFTVLKAYYRQHYFHRLKPKNVCAFGFRSSLKKSLRSFLISVKLSASKKYYGFFRGSKNYRDRGV